MSLDSASVVAIQNAIQSIVPVVLKGEIANLPGIFHPFSNIIISFAMMLISSLVGGILHAHGASQSHTQTMKQIEAQKSTATTTQQK